MHCFVSLQQYFAGAGHFKRRFGPSSLAPKNKGYVAKNSSIIRFRVYTQTGKLFNTTYGEAGRELLRVPHLPEGKQKPAKDTGKTELQDNQGRLEWGSGAESQPVNKKLSNMSTCSNAIGQG